jgi:hypothetical protein
MYDDARIAALLCDSHTLVLSDLVANRQQPAVRIGQCHGCVHAGCWFATFEVESASGTPEQPTLTQLHPWLVESG